MQQIPLPVIKIQLPVECGQFNSNSTSWTEMEPILKTRIHPNPRWSNL